MFEFAGAGHSQELQFEHGAVGSILTLVGRRGATERSRVVVLFFILPIVFISFILVFFGLVGLFFEVLLSSARRGGT